MRLAAGEGDGGVGVRRLIQLALLLAVAAPAWGKTYFIREDGGTLLSVNVPGGQCDGLSDLPVAGAVSHHCALNDFRYMYDDDSGVVGSGSWALSGFVGGDKVVIRGCHALGTQESPSNPNCRLGWDERFGVASPPSAWCVGVGNQTCFNPPIPAGSSGAHTVIEGGCAFDNTPCTPINNNFPYGTTNEVQLFGGFGLTWTFNLSGTQWVDIVGIELTTHNNISSGNPGAPGNCTFGGSPALLVSCANNQPLDDYAQNAFLTDNATAHVTLTDVYEHSFNSAGMFGPIGGAINMTRVFMGFNGFAGWNLADVSDTPNAAGSSITGSYVTLIGNGCYSEYPIVHTAFPARACYDDLSGGFGDAISGQDSPLDTMVWDHGVIRWNTKDGFIGPHTQIKHLTITNTEFNSNMGQDVKFGTDTNADVLFQNNVVNGSAYRMSEALPGAAQNFALSTGLPGSYLSDFGRAAGDIYSLITQAGSTLSFVGNTSIGTTQTFVDFNCGKVDHSGSVTGGGTCGSVPIVWKDNTFVGWINPDCTACAGLAPGLWFAADSSINFTSSFNLEFGIRNGDPCTGNILCTDPTLNGQPAQTPWAGEAAFDVYLPLTALGFYPLVGSPLILAGTPVGGLTADYYGISRTNPPWIGAVNSLAPVTGGGVSVGGGVVLSGSVIMQ